MKILLLIVLAMSIVRSVNRLTAYFTNEKENTLKIFFEFILIVISFIVFGYACKMLLI
jgi:hypothetical protein